MAQRSVAARAAGAALAAALLACSPLRPAMPEEVPIHRARSEGALRAGAAAVDVTPEGPVFLGGYSFMRRSRGVHDPIWARALVLEVEGLRLGLVVVDVVGLEREDRLRLSPRLAELGFDPRHVVVSATHNHSGPDTLGLWGLPPFVSGRDAETMARIEDGVVEALGQAAAALRPAELAAAAVHVDPAGLMRNLRRPGLVDEELVVVHVREAAGGPTVATLVELGCHPEALTRENHEITSDFPNWTRAVLEEQLGGVGIFVSGALGGLVTPDTERSGDARDFAEAERVGRAVAAHAVGAVGRLGDHAARLRLGVWHVPFHASIDNWRYSVLKATGVLERTFFRGGLLESEVNVWEIGGLRAATLPGEITPDLGLRVKRALRGAPSLLIGLGNDELGYLLPSSDYHLPLYDYERTVSPGRDAGDLTLRRVEDVMLLLEAPSPD
jgi:hypothetical protein